MRICKDGRIWGQTNKQARNHLGILIKRRGERKGTASSSKLGKLNPMYGRHHTAEARKKQSEARWNGGISSKEARIKGGIQFRLWREAIYARDNWACQECGRRDGGLNAHHIKSFAYYPELRFALDNGKTLCFKCHRLTKNFGGGCTKSNELYINSFKGTIRPHKDL